MEVEEVDVEVLVDVVEVEVVVVVTTVNVEEYTEFSVIGVFALSLTTTFA